MMRASSACVNLITQFEKLHLTAYKPTPTDKWTLGYGHTEGVEEGMTCIINTAWLWLYDDLHWAEDAVNRHVTVSDLTQNQFDALCSLTYNIGAGAFEESTLLRKLNDGDIAGAADEFARWNHQNGKALDGLTLRRAAEKALFVL
jgi:lysozyme